MFKEDCQKCGGEGSGRGLGPDERDAPFLGAVRASVAQGGQKGELASFPVLQWLLCLQSHPWAPVLIRVVSLLGTVRAACGCVAMF